MRPQSRQKQDTPTLIRNLKPVLNEGQYAFCLVKDMASCTDLPFICLFREAEGFTLIVEKEIADQCGLEYYYIGAWITLQIQSSLTSIGLTAAVSEVLARNRITCNMIAGYHHDHVFVEYSKSDTAMQVLRQLSRNV